MKKLMILMLILAMTAGLAMTGYAAEDKLTLSDGAAAAGETVYLVVTLEESVVGDTMGITYTYDAGLLKAVPTSCTWDRDSVLEDFANNNTGVWAASKAQDLKGRVCTLALNVLPEASFTETEVTCELLVKNGSEEVGRYTAQAKVTMACDHRYGDWADTGTIGHSRTCALCGGNQTQSHTWDDGKLTADPSDRNYVLKIQTCTLCGAEKSYRMPADSGEEIPSATQQPEATAPEKEHPYTQPPRVTEPETRPSYGQQGSSGNQSGREEPTNSYHDYNQGTAPVSGGDGHDHSHDGDSFLNGPNTGVSRPVAVPAGDDAAEEESEEATEHDHDYDSVTPALTSGERTGTALGILAVVLVLLGGAVWFVKKKH